MMTLKEKVKSIEPDKLSNKYDGGLYGCPSSYEYLPNMDLCDGRPICEDEACTKCWNQEMPEKEDDYTYLESASIRHKKADGSSDEKSDVYYSLETVAAVFDDIKREHTNQCSLYETQIAILKKHIELLKAAVSEEFTASDYHEAALRTASGKCRSLANCAMGLAGEAGECADIIKKHLFHDHDLDKEHLAKELGDVAWYIAVCAEVIGYNLEDILKMNIEKLKARYPDGFDSEKSKNRAEDDI